LGLEYGDAAVGSAPDRADTWRRSLADSLGVEPELVSINEQIVRLDVTLPAASAPIRALYLYGACEEGGAVLAFRGTDADHVATWDGIAQGVAPCSSEVVSVSSPPLASIAPLPFEPITLKGRGDKVARFKIPADAAAIATIKATGRDNFAVWTLDASGSETDLLVNEIGAYAGTVLFDENEGDHSVAFEVTASGSWTIRVKPISAARVWEPTGSLKGKGDDVVQLTPPATGLSATDVRHTGKGNFAIWAYSTDGTDLLVNDIGRYSGQVLLPDGTFLLAITADGSWTMSAPG
jgi:hypothetical protein